MHVHPITLPAERDNAPIRRAVSVLTQTEAGLSRECGRTTPAQISSFPRAALYDGPRQTRMSQISPTASNDFPSFRKT